MNATTTHTDNANATPCAFFALPLCVRVFCSSGCVALQTHTSKSLFSHVQTHNWLYGLCVGFGSGRCLGEGVLSGVSNTLRRYDDWCESWGCMSDDRLGCNLNGKRCGCGCECVCVFVGSATTISYTWEVNTRRMGNWTYSLLCEICICRGYNTTTMFFSVIDNMWH